jgi:hypothetical protein
MAMQSSSEVRQQAPNTADGLRIDHHSKPANENRVII